MSLLAISFDILLGETGVVKATPNQSLVSGHTTVLKSMRAGWCRG